MKRSPSLLLAPSQTCFLVSVALHLLPSLCCSQGAQASSHGTVVTTTMLQQRSGKLPRQQPLGVLCDDPGQSLDLKERTRLLPAALFLVEAMETKSPTTCVTWKPATGYSSPAPALKEGGGHCTNQI